MLQDQVTRLTNDLANSEVQKSGLESQLRLTQWPQDNGSHQEEELIRQLQSVQRERTDLKGKVDSLTNKVFQYNISLLYFTLFNIISCTNLQKRCSDIIGISLAIATVYFRRFSCEFLVY